ncbi:MAG: hypothetical protein EPN53_15975 [Acidobacteria bacterium]|nr:MAG: hypothetical protein EPN53_15975 [Acidobacteriota bacterium]
MTTKNGLKSAQAPRPPRRAGLAALTLLLAAATSVLPAAPAAAKGRPGADEVMFKGTIAVLPATTGWIGDWTVGTTTVHVTAATEIDQEAGAVAVGATVRVEGQLGADGSVAATSIEVMAPPQGARGTTALCGAITTLPTSGTAGDWVVGSTTVHVDAATVLDEQQGSFAIGVTVLVRGQVESDGSMTAVSVKTLAGGCGDPGGLASSLFAVLHLTATPDAPAGAEGVVVTRHFTFSDGTDRQDFKVGVEGLLPQTEYAVVVDGASAGVITTGEDGEGNLFLSTAGMPGAEPLPAALQPVEDLKTISVNSPSGVAVLTGDFANARVNSHDSPAPDYLAAAVLTSGMPGVVGIVSASINGGVQTVAIGVWGLTPGASYDVVIDGTTLSTLTASEGGRLHAEFSTSPDEGEAALPNGFLPVSALLHVDLLDQTAAVVASGDFRNVTGTTGGVAVGKAVKRKFGH